MALRQELTIDATGATYPEAYFRIMKINIDTPLALDATTITLEVQGYVDIEARQQEKAAVWAQSFQFGDETLDFSTFTSPDNIKTALYLLLKTTDYFASATDV
jgi:hypothetical protein